MQLPIETVFGITIGFCSSLVWGSSVVVYRSQASEIRPLAIGSLKMWAAFLFMTVLVLLYSQIEPFLIPEGAALFLVASLLVGALIGDTAYLYSHERIGVSYAFPISMSYPMFTYILAIVFFGEPLLLSRSVGVILAIIGLSLVTREQNTTEISSRPSRLDLVGVAFALTAAVTYAVGIMLLQIGMANTDPIHGNFFRVFFVSLAFIPVYLTMRHQGMPTPPRRTLKIVAVVGLIGMGLGSLLFSTAVKFAGATITSVIGSMSPLFALPISIIFLKERVSRIAALGVLVTVTGVILVILQI
jgi:drug/metabolite transporter (DMT)-like permease